ncbi:hypothetical protein [Dolosigranulum pigrum]|uniref:hypothetical protein n=1 Tax=Dolosigranulum pigrum TaxID=29394 RepID=UPI000DC37873|nr:hypothetical protein [Dolosigranulum pigrum]RAN54001.1 hypothetical protein B8A31_02505 [Dolosigranulum pigrum]
MFDFLGYETTIGSLLFTFALMYIFGRGYRKLFKEDDDHVEARKWQIAKEEEKLNQQKKEIKEIGSSTFSVGHHKVNTSVTE